MNSLQNFGFEDDDLAMYAMGLLTPPEASAIARAASDDPSIRARLSELQAQLAAFAEITVRIESVPEGSLDRLLGRIATERQGRQTAPVVPFRPAKARLPNEGDGLQRTEPRDGRQTDSQTSSHVVPRIAPQSSQRPAPIVPTFGQVPIESDGSASTAEPGRALPRTGWLTWTGWAVAAALALTAGTLYRERAALHATVSSEAGQVAAVSGQTAEANRQRAALDAQLSGQTAQLQTLTAGQAATEKEMAAARSEADQLRSAASLGAGRLHDLTAQLTEAETERTAAEAQRAAVQTERDTLQARLTAQTSTLSAQTSQIDRLTIDAARAREVLETLTDRTALRVTLTQPKGRPEPTGRATYLASRGTVVFQGNNLAALDPGKVYQLWLLPADGSAPISAGSFSPDARGNANLVNSRLAGSIAAKAFAITIENQGGSQTPTLPILLVGAAG